jgi:enterochelin esterase family protein
MLKYEYWIYVPAQYKPGCPAAFMVFQDGLHFVGIDDAQLNTPTVLDNLIASGDMPVTIALLINPGEPGDGHYDGHETPIRSVQYDTNTDAYVSFLVNEFIPANVIGKYDIVTDPDGWGIGGHSSGGIAAFMAGWYRPDKFRKLLTFDASFPNTHDNMGVSLLDAINMAAAKPLRTYLMSGPNDLGGWYDANTNAATELAAKNYHYIYRVESSAHYPPLAAQQDFPTALRWTWRGYKL